MSDFKFNAAKVQEGEAAFQRGVPLSSMINDVRLLMTDPNQANYLKASPAVQEQWEKDQERREADANGLVVGYANAILQAIRRIDNALMGGSSL